MNLYGVLLLALVGCVAADDVSAPLAYRLRLKRQFGGDPNLENIPYPNQGLNGNEYQQNRPPNGFGFQDLSNQGSSGGGGFNNQGSSGNGGFNNQGSFGNGGFGSQGSSNGGFNNQGSFGNNGFGTQGSSNGGFGNQGLPNGGFNNQGSFGNGGFGNQGSSSGGFNNQGSFGNGGGFGNSGSNAQDVIRPQTTQRSPLNLIVSQNTVNEAQCIRNCPTTSQYAPVCGTDNITYSNQAKLNCAKMCGRQVTYVYSGSCVTTRAPN